MREQLIDILGGVKNHHVVLKKHQGTDDIIDGILKTHNQYKSDYDKIYKYFYTGDIKSTCKKIWDFLKSNVKYKIESERLQTLRSPATILSYPADCKSYALFINGCIDAINRNENTNWKFKYRFAGYNPIANYIEHTFAVVKKNNSSDEIWIDPVLDSFNEKKQPTYFIDKKTNNMALVGIAGINDDEKIGSIDGIGKFNPPSFLTGKPLSLTPNPDLKKTQTGTNKALSTISDLANIIPGWGTAISQVLKIFNVKSVPNPNDWQGWAKLDSKGGFMLGTNAATWVLQDGDSTQNEAWNLMKWVEQYGVDTIVNNNEHIKQRFGKYITAQDLINKIRRGGYIQEAQALEDSLKPSPIASMTAGSNLWVTLALVGAGVYAVTKMRK